MIALSGIWLIVLFGKDDRGSALGDQRRYLLRGVPTPHDQPAAPCTQIRIELAQPSQEEGYPLCAGVAL
jgi:hypothetical protein